MWGGKSILVHKGTRDNPLIDVYKCSECGTRFLSVREDNDYENGFMHKANIWSDLNIDERLQVFRDDDIRRYNMVNEICIGKNVLDFGCGFGGFISFISRVAHTCSGVELGRTEREYLNTKGIECFRTIDDCQRKFDVITMFHTFEHLTNPHAWLKRFSEYLVKDGYLIIEVPNGNDALLSLYESEKFADFTYWSAHLFLYTIKSLSMLIEKTGYFNILSAGQVQRYSLANHLMWLSKGLPGGDKVWNYLNSNELNTAYAKKLEELEMCDTLFFVLQLK